MDEAIRNLQNFQMFAKMMYPMYSAPLAGDGGSLGRTIKAPPLLRIKFVNLVQSADGDGSLLGCISGVTLNPVQDSGFFVETGGDLYPKEFSIDFTFHPQHESPLGWDSTNSEFLTNNFPYTTIVEEQKLANQREEEPQKSAASDDRALN